MFREKRAKSSDERADQRDSFSRNAKHKANFDLEEEFQHGDEVEAEVEETDENGNTKTVKKSGMVKNPKAPLGMVGITIDGRYTLIPEDELMLIDEALNRMNELSK